MRKISEKLDSCSAELSILIFKHNLSPGEVLAVFAENIANSCDIVAEPDEVIKCLNDLIQAFLKINGEKTAK